MIDPITISDPDILAKIEDIKNMRYHKFEEKVTFEFIIGRAIVHYHQRKKDKALWQDNYQGRLGYLKRAQAGRCGYCNILVGRRKGTIDHIVPLVRGGAMNDPTNLIFCCEPCNQEKMEATADEFRNMKLIERAMCKDDCYYCKPITP